jgi:hypothetical protein
VLAQSAVLDVAALAFIWLMIVLLVDPRGNFPLNDDWSYGRAVQNLVERHSFALTGFTSMPLLAQVVWGALFCLPAGFSFTALRVSTLVLGFVGIVATYELLKEARASRGFALMGALLVALNPLYCVLAFSFMTDVPFFAFSMLAILFLVRGTVRDRPVSVYIGVLFTFVALLIRQPAMLILLAFAVTYPLCRGFTRITISRAVMPVFFGVGFLIAYRRLLEATTGVPVLYNRAYDPLTESAAGFVQALGQVLDRLFVAAIYLGLFALPVALIVAGRRWRNSSGTIRQAPLVLSAAVSAIVMAALIWSGRRFPLTGNVLSEDSLGPTLLRDTYILRLRDFPHLPGSVWWAVTAGAVTGAVLVAQRIAATGIDLVRTIARKRIVTDFPSAFALVLGLVYAASIAVTGYLDRYLIFALPLVLMTVAAAAVPGRWRWHAGSVAAATLVVVFGFFSVAATHDYLSWNRARWAALRHLTNDMNVSYRDIDGGFEFNGWYGYDPTYRETSGVSPWWVQNDRYLISFAPLPAYEVTNVYRYGTWMPIGPREIFVLHRP